MIRRPPESTLLPCTPLFRSELVGHDRQPDVADVPVATRRRAGADLGQAVATAVQLLRRAGDVQQQVLARSPLPVDRKSTRLNSSHANISYAVFCLKKKKTDG